MYLILPAIVFALMIWAFVDIIPRDSSQVRHLPKTFWIFLIILMPFVGSVLWFALGREYESSIPAPRPFLDAETRAPSGRSAPSTEEQLAALEREIEQAERIRELEARIEARRMRQPGQATE